MVFLALMACILVGVAAYNLTCAFVDVPTSKTSKMMMFAKKQQGIRSEKLHEVYITKIATKLWACQCCCPAESRSREL